MSSLPLPLPLPLPVTTTRSGRQIPSHPFLSQQSPLYHCPPCLFFIRHTGPSISALLHLLVSTAPARTVTIRSEHFSLDSRSHDFSPCSTSSLRHRTCCAIALSKVRPSSNPPTVPGRGTGTVSHGRLRFTQLRRPPKHVQPPSKTIEQSPRRDHKAKKWTLQ